MNAVKEYYYWFGYIEGQDSVPYKHAFHEELLSTITFRGKMGRPRAWHEFPEFIIEYDKLSSEFITMAVLRGHTMIKFAASIRDFRTIDIIDDEKNQEIYNHFCDAERTYTR